MAAQFDTQFDQIVFSGGGIRCFWHGGFLAEAGSKLDLSVKRVSAVSGGALSAAAWIGGRERDLLMLMTEAFKINDRNYDLKRSNFIPHQEIYRAVVEKTLDQAAIDRIADGPKYQVRLSCPPDALPARVSSVFYGILYKLDQAIRGTPHRLFRCRQGDAHLGAGRARCARLAGTARSRQLRQMS